MRKISIIAASLSVLALAACSTENSVTSPDLNVSYGKSATATYSNGPTWVHGEFTIQGSSGITGTGDPGVNSHPELFGTCRQANGVISTTTADNTTWFNSAGHKTGANFCAGGVQTTATLITCTIDGINNDDSGLPATYAFGGTTGPGTGSQTLQNENLNFYSDDLQQDINLFIHYASKGNKTTGLGTLVVNYACDDQSSGTAYIPLAQYTGSGNFYTSVDLLGRSIVKSNVKVYSNFEGTTELGDLTELDWLYRSRVAGQGL